REGVLYEYWLSRRAQLADDAPWTRIAPAGTALRIDPSGAGHAYHKGTEIFWQALDAAFSPAGEPGSLGEHPENTQMYSVRTTSGEIVLELREGPTLELFLISPAGEILETRTESVGNGGIIPTVGGGFALIDFPEAHGIYRTFRAREGGPGLQL